MFTLLGRARRSRGRGHRHQVTGTWRWKLWPREEWRPSGRRGHPAPQSENRGPSASRPARGVTLAHRGGDPVGVHSPVMFTYEEVLIAKLGG